MLLLGLGLLSGHIESLYFVAINARDVGKITQWTLIKISLSLQKIKSMMPFSSKSK